MASQKVMSEEQDRAFKVYRLSDLARLHLGKHATVGATAGGKYFVIVGGKTVVEGTYEAVVDYVTSRGGEAMKR